MPFSRYLQSNERDHPHDDDIDHTTFSTNVHFQLPNLIFNAPSVPPGGGAEALPAGLYPPSSSIAWFAPPDGYAHPFSSHSLYHPNPPPLPQNINIPFAIPPSLGLPIYSASGFDLLSLLARVVSRPFPKIYLGPVDLSCSFVLTDTRRFDAPIVYASPSFLKLTGYDQHEVVGRNCRFLQAPGGLVQRGQDRIHTSRDAVAHMRKNIVADKECQVTIINYRKDGSAFINMVSVIPLPGGLHNNPDESDDIFYHIGFQVDLTEQPKSILTKLKDGSYVVNYSDKSVSPHALPSRDWRASSMSMRGTSNDLRALLSDPPFSSSFHLSTSTHASTAIALSNSPSEPISLDPYDGNKPLHMFILDRSPDFLHVVSLKGAFLYVAPAVRYVLGYDPDELVGRSLTHFCHPADCVPLMRELKEASATPGPLLLTTTSPSSSSHNLDSSTQPSPSSAAAAPRPVDLLFRMQAKGRGYVWIQCRGRLHVEPGKGRKAIILSGRIRNMPYLEWGPISRAGGLVPPSPRSLPSSLAPVSDRDDQEDDRSLEREFWGLLSTNATFLYVGAAVRDALGWGAGEVIGKRLADFVSGNSIHEVHMAIEAEMAKVLVHIARGSQSSGLACNMRTKDSNPIPVHIVLYRSRAPSLPGGPDALADPAAQAPIVCQVKLCDGTAPPPTSHVLHPHGESVFDETELDRESSWQYELQQLKFRNQRLAEEVAALEAGIAKRIQRKQSSGAMASESGGARMHMKLPAPLSAGIPPPSAPPLLTVRFVSDGHPRAETSQSARSHLASPLSLAIPPLVSAHGSSPMERPLIQQPALMPPSGAPPPGFEHGRGESGVYQTARMRHSTESSLQGWSSYNYDHAQVVDMGAGQIAPGASQVPTAYNLLPMKRSWDNSLRDPGGGGS